MPQELKKKLTVRDIMGAKVQTLAAVQALISAGNSGKNPVPLAICRIIGRTNKGKPGSTDKGEFMRFVGEFVGINMLTGEQLSAGAVILPGAAESAIYGALGPLNDKGESVNTVEFAVEVSVKYDAASATLYTYTCTPLIEPKTSDPMKALMQAAGVKQLAAPAPVAAIGKK